MYPGRNFPPRRQNRRENVNESIRVREVRAVFPDGTAEVMPTAQALRKAQEMGLDLVLVSPTAVPPVAKAVDFGHYQYELKKKQHEAKKNQNVRTFIVTSSFSRFNQGLQGSPSRGSTVMDHTADENLFQFEFHITGLDVRFGFHCLTPSV
jgi:hypothetical protein